MTIPINIGSDPVVKVYVGASATEAIYVGEDKVWPVESAYTGPLDIVPGAVVAYGQRALSAAKLGTALYTIRRDSDDTTQSFNSDATTGAAPATSITSFIGSGDGFISSWSDQGESGGDLSQSSNNSQPLWKLDSGTNKPYFTTNYFDHLAQSLMFSNGQITVFCVCRKSVSIHFSEGSSSFDLDISPSGFGGSSITPVLGSGDNAAGGSFYPTNEDNLSIVDYALQYGSANVRYNGVTASQTDNYDAGGAVATFSVSNASAGPSGETGDDCRLAELIIYSSILSDADRLAIRQNIAAYYGITLP